jgi:hypothetical protein
MSENNTGVTVTLKAGVGFEAPWIVIHASDVSDALKQVDTGDFATLAERTVSAAQFFRAAHTGKTAFPGAQTTADVPPQAAPAWSEQGSQQSYQQPPQQAAPVQQGGKQCAHGAMVYREAKPGSGKDWKAYFCPTPKDTPGQCKPEFLK